MREITYLQAIYEAQHEEMQRDDRVFIIGHPLGGSLSISLNDNLFLDWEDPRLHYRAPTEPGSAGSPIFDDQWRLIGMHHAGGRNMRRLNGKEGTYEAKEGIWIQAILRQIATDIQDSDRAIINDRLRPRFNI